MDKLRALSYFKRTAELNSFSTAAKEFDVPASSISRRIKDLENELGVELLQRTTRNVTLTELGQVYYEKIVDILQRLHDVDELISQRRDALEGKIRISATPSYGQRILAPILRKFRKHYPQIILDLHFTDELTILGKDAVDIAIRAGNAPNEHVVAKKLSNAEFKLVASPELLSTLQSKFGHTTLTLEDLAVSPVLQYKGKFGALTWWHQIDNAWKPTEIKPSFWCNSGETLLEAVLAGEGITLFPQWWVNDHLKKGALSEVPMGLPISNLQTPNYDVFMLYQQAKYQIPKIKHCIDFILNHTKES